ncbi:MAG TPA: hypothetical protein VI072_16085 [Polyangiaceae bacterium]
MIQRKLAVCTRDARSSVLLPVACAVALTTLGCGAEDDAPQPSPRAGKTAQARWPLAGIDGPETVTLPNTVVNRYTALAQNAAAAATSLQVQSAAALADGSDALASGDLLLVMQMQGASINTTANSAAWGQITSLGGAGLYEFAEVRAVNAATNTITVSCGLRNSYGVSGQVQVIRVPQYTTLTVAASASLTAPPWNGTTGGVLAVHAQSTVQLNGALDVSGRGFRGGPSDNTSASSAVNTILWASADAAAGGRKGESVAGLSTLFGRGAPANGGGGGNAHNAGGGGGANARRGGAWTGQGVFDLSVTGGTAAWLLDPNYSATGSEGGGRGGYTFSSDNRNALTLAPGNALWDGNARRERGGLGGRPLDNDPGSRLFPGGGGGAGDGNNAHAGRGGNGGGIVIVLAGSVTGAGQIRANGETGVLANSTAGGSASGDAPGGGGGGGSVVVRATTVQGFSVQARGGAGGNQLIDNDDEAEGPGGGGGGGYVAISATTTADVRGGPAGTTSSPALAEFPVNGATRGGEGLAQFGSAVTGDVPFCADTAAPNTTIVSRPTNPTSDVTGSFVFDSPGEPNASFECRIDGAPFTVCTRSFTTAPLAPGSHTLQVRAKDAVGNVDASPASYTWVIDTTAPDTTIATRPANPTSDVTGDFTFTSNEAGVRFECSVDAAIFSACGSSFATLPLNPGTHGLRVRARDAAGNVDATPAQYTWQVTRVTTDSDGDGLDDATETGIGTDPNDADTDDDGVPDGQEPSPGNDSDGDGLVNARDPDSDNDGLFDGTELGLGCSNPGTDPAAKVCRPDADSGATKTSPIDADTDDGGVRDGAEDTNGNGVTDPGEIDPTAGHGADDRSARDSDDDGLTDDQETGIGSNPNDADSDDDGLLDGEEPNPGVDGDGDGLISVLDADSDDDALFDGTETGKNCASPATDATKKRCKSDADPATKTLPLVRDTDGGGVIDGSEDTNLDGKLDAGEKNPIAGQGADDSSVVDSDGDGLSNPLETTLGSNPNDKDSDDDGLPDGEEANPSEDHDLDGKLDVLDSDSDGDGLFDGTESGLGCDDPAIDRTQNACRADADPQTTTAVLVPDTDDGGVSDGDEDSNKDGRRDAGERDPLDPSDDGTPPPDGGLGGTGGSAGDGGSSGADGGAGDGGSSGASGSAGDGGSSGASGSAGDGGSSGVSGSGGSAGSFGADGDSVVLGGGLCAYRAPIDPTGSLGAWFALLGALFFRIARRRRA